MAPTLACHAGPCCEPWWTGPRRDGRRGGDACRAGRGGTRIPPRGAVEPPR
jgi:hypothetical protein